ncbi:putative RNA interference and gene silencing protein [Lophium mytilinum]|uniref:Putative RNA interference and gene silencing protein n=1 Tax=Lophium mytilinum TaxID=390894 RepID=A0A6A6QH80_9PEZI|nr:putative RNA interference and gene silencing protein [Lophium mytilinum]
MSTPGGQGFRGGRGTGRGDRGGYRGGRGAGGAGRGGGDRGPVQEEVQIYVPPDKIIPAPNTHVAQVEDAIQKSAGGPDALAALTMTEGFPHRPGYGTRGTPVTLWANYVEMVPPPELTLYRYDMAVSPSAAGKKLTQIVRLLLETETMAQFRSDVITDFKSTLLSRRKLASDDFIVRVRYRVEDHDEPREGATQYQVRVQYTTALSTAQLVNYLESTDISERLHDVQPLVQALNIFLNHYAKSTGNLATIGASKTFSLGPSAAKWDLGAGLTALRGFFSSVRLATCRILVNVNVSHGAFYDAIPLEQLITKYGAAHNNSKGKLAKFLEKVRIRTTHLPEKKNKAGQVIHRMKTIFGLANRNDGHGLPHPPRVREYGAGPKDVEFWLDSPAQSSSSSTAAKGDGKKKGKKGAASGAPQPASGGRYISVYDFFLQTYNIAIANPRVPVVNVGNRENPTYLPAQVCHVMPGQNSKAKLDANQTAQMIRFAVRRPGDNATSIVQHGLETAGLSPHTNPLLTNFNVSVPQKLITVLGRVLTEPKVNYKQKNAQIRLGSWNMMNYKVNTAGNLKSWSYLLVSSPGKRDAFNDEQSLTEVMGRLHSTLKDVGIAASPPAKGKKISITGPDDPQLENTIKGAAGAGLALLFIILPSDNAPEYNRIKQYGDVKYGIHTICSFGNKLAKENGQDQYFRNVALKFNLKLGGINQLVDHSRLGLINEDKTMVVGIDVTHPSPGSKSNAPSVAGMVASVDCWLGQWPAVLRIQDQARAEMVTDLGDMLKSRLKLWKEKGKHQAFPENILIYRDGVSEGQYSLVMDSELPLLRSACAEVYPAPDQKKGLPNITIIVVGKRHHTRFFPTKLGDSDKLNPKPGTVVDRGVTMARNWDFFLQPHSALQGTARPAHYYIVLDEIFRRRYKTVPAPFKNVADVVEDLTHSMCYAYGRATKAVSLCPPAYYADIVCERARCYLNDVFEGSTDSGAVSVAGSEALVGNADVLIHPRLRDGMFYI